MKKAYTILFVAAAAVMLLAHLRLSAHSPHVLAARTSPHPAQEQQPGLSDDGTQVVLHFASNPQPMPPFLLADLEGEIISTAAWQGKVVLLNFWATWCPPCREEIPMMNELSHRYRERLQIVGVSMDDSSPAEVRSFAKEIGIDYPIVMGSGALSREYGGVPALPTTFVINTDGRIVEKHEGLYPIEVYDNEIRALLGEHVDAKVETFEDTGQIFLKNAINAKELPGVDFKGLTDTQKRAALKKLNSQYCTCGCKLTIAQCRINDSECATSQALAQKIVHQIRAGSSPSALPVPSSPASTTIRQ